MEQQIKKLYKANISPINEKDVEDKIKTQIDIVNSNIDIFFKTQRELN